MKSELPDIGLTMPLSIDMSVLLVIFQIVAMSLVKIVSCHRLYLSIHGVLMELVVLVVGVNANYSNICGGTVAVVILMVMVMVMAMSNIILMVI